MPDEPPGPADGPTRSLPPQLWGTPPGRRRQARGSCRAALGPPGTLPKGMVQKYLRYLANDGECRFNAGKSAAAAGCL